MSPIDRSRTVRRLAVALGFDLVGIAPAVSPPGYDHFLDWLAEGFAAGMGYLHRHAEARRHPEHVLPGVRSVVMVGLSYKPAEADPPESPRSGKVARYARGRDYHQVLWKRLGTLADRVGDAFPGSHCRAVADSAPLLERDFARLAGLGWIGKNTMLIHKQIGSYTVLGALLTDLDLEPDLPFGADHCGTCTRCLDACPTDAFAGPYRLDAGRCISYATIEHRGDLPDDLADSLHGWLFGCDICQEVCPWNRKAPPGRDPELAADPARAAPDLIDLLEADDEAIARLIRGSAMTRAKRSGMLRNAAALLAERGLSEALPALADRLEDEDPVVRAACARAMARIGNGKRAQSLGDEEGKAKQ
ncbi:tRNA epoxyqueuosine(34) reductase QueG [Tautonia sociabilis]|uniref:tRNA epoxyqueuosine(34) reductase QueG n=1 Tax=Tautonia sociabilis TaxID=2080755 RepID=A0A432MPS0_9BACT|nr:tRNA epoxyqueuosine(34) reductase QueG [Tautonia sociabilis]RUL89157.1 tRNA epoxyqueuosine(34) reductase QueG [Tautonia sociabilis]